MRDRTRYRVVLLLPVAALALAVFAILWWQPGFTQTVMALRRPPWSVVAPAVWLASLAPLLWIAHRHGLQIAHPEPRLMLGLREVWRVAFGPTDAPRTASAPPSPFDRRRAMWFGVAHGLAGAFPPTVLLAVPEFRHAAVIGFLVGSGILAGLSGYNHRLARIYLRRDTMAPRLRWQHQYLDLERYTVDGHVFVRRLRRYTVAWLLWWVASVGLLTRVFAA